MPQAARKDPTTQRAQDKESKRARGKKFDQVRQYFLTISYCAKVLCLVPNVGGEYSNISVVEVVKISFLTANLHPS